MINIKKVTHIKLKDWEKELLKNGNCLTFARLYCEAYPEIAVKKVINPLNIDLGLNSIKMKLEIYLQFGIKIITKIFSTLK